jgi:hypothetical protein
VKVPLSTFCPVCKSKSQPNRLNRELGAEEVFCVNPVTQKPLHTFPSIENAEAYDPNLAFLEAQGETEEETPAPTPKPKAAPRVAAPKAKVAELDPVPVAAEKPVSTMNVEELVMEAAAEDSGVTHFYPDNDESRPAQMGSDAEEIKTHVVPGLFNTPQPAKVVKFVPPPARKAPGGVLLITVRIPDEHTSFLVAEAESQKESVETYFQRVLEYGLSSRWFY